MVDNLVHYVQNSPSKCLGRLLSLCCKVHGDVRKVEGTSSAERGGERGRLRKPTLVAKKYTLLLV